MVLLTAPVQPTIATRRATMPVAVELAGFDLATLHLCGVGQCLDVAVQHQNTALESIRVPTTHTNRSEERSGTVYSSWVLRARRQAARAHSIRISPGHVQSSFIVPPAVTPGTPSATSLIEAQAASARL